MKFLIVAFSALLAHSVAAFTVHPEVSTTKRSFVAQQHKYGGGTLFSTLQSDSNDVIDVVDETAVETAKSNLKDVAIRLKYNYGTFIVDKKAKEELTQAVKDLEFAAGSRGTPSVPSAFIDQFLGNWTLLCTTSTSYPGVDTSSLPFLNSGPLQSLRESLTSATNKYLSVQQKVRSTQQDGVVDRIDHVLEYMPPAELRDLFRDVPEQITQLNINPLQVSDSKFILAHKATVDTDVYPVRTKLALTSVVLNVAGKSTMLDPNGKDVLGINVPLGEMLNAGDFETTYMDENLRISRGKQGFVDQLRVFMKTPSPEPVDEPSTSMDADETGVGGSDGSDVSPSDVEEYD